jgi:hypothetical protein
VGADVPKSDVPRSIVAKANKVSPLVGTLVKDLRKLMGPYTATHLKERRYFLIRVHVIMIIYVCQLQSRKRLLCSCESTWN